MFFGFALFLYAVFYSRIDLENSDLLTIIVVVVERCIIVVVVTRCIRAVVSKAWDYWIAIRIMRSFRASLVTLACRHFHHTENVKLSI